MSPPAAIADDELLGLLHETVDAVRHALVPVEDWRRRGAGPGQYGIDLVADAAALAVLDRPGIGVLSEESGLHRPGAPVLVVVDPVDGSTNASRRLPWYATSACALDADGPRAAVVANQATGERFEAVRGGGARLDGRPIGPGACRALDAAVVGLSGYPDRHLGWRQFRALGAAALDLCAVAAGRLDAYIDCGEDAHGPWDYLGGLLVCQEAGAPVADLHGRSLVARAHADRRTVLAAGTAELLDEVVAARAGMR